MTYFQKWPKMAYSEESFFLCKKALGMNSIGWARAKTRQNRLKTPKIKFLAESESKKWISKNSIFDWKMTDKGPKSSIFRTKSAFLKLFSTEIGRIFF